MINPHEEYAGDPDDLLELDHKHNPHTEYMIGYSVSYSKLNANGILLTCGVRNKWTRAVIASRGFSFEIVALPGVPGHEQQQLQYKLDRIKNVLDTVFASGKDALRDDLCILLGAERKR